MQAKVLLIDDSRFLRAALEKTLSGNGFEVQVAKDSEEGLRLAEQEGDFDIILLDLFLPKTTGQEVLKRLKQNPATAGIPVLVLSGTTYCLPKATLDLMAVVASMEELLETGASPNAQLSPVGK
ncbi:MAG TPA: response regulator [Terriglobales bacterium]|jgi:CheY-like chemotaxis protein|nr:response regulator [Terriglobales bacterium]